VFDLRVHPQALSDQDLETLTFFGVERVLLVADATIHPATPTAIFAHFEHLLSVELPRFERRGLRARVALGVHPAVVPRRGLSQVLETLPAYLREGKVAALGLLGLLRGGEAEEEALLAQLELAQTLGLPALVTTPHHDREAITRRLLRLLTEAPVKRSRVLIDGATGKTVRTIHALGFFTGLTLHPEHLSAERAVALVRAMGVERLVLDTGIGDGAADLLALPRAARLLTRAGLSRRVVERVTSANAAAFLAGESQ
jgi:predicted metal-dependent TIM-barrel fold hydrolase